MTTILAAVSSMFSAIFGSTGYIKGVIDLIVGNDFLLVGLALMVSGAAVSYLSRLIRT